MPHDVMQQIQQEKLNVQESGNEVLADSLGRIQQYAKNSVEDLNALNVIVNELTSGGNNLSNSIDKVVYYFEKYKSVSKQATDSTNIFRSSYDGLGSRSSSQLKKLTSSLQEVKDIQTELGSNFKFSATDNVVLLTRQISKLKNTLKGLGNIELNVSPKNLPKFQTGGKVTGGPSSGDKILARLNAGQYVFNKRQMSNLGRFLGKGKQLSHQQVFKLAGGKPVVQKQGQIPKFATGGQITQRRRRYMSDSQLQTQSNDVNQKIYQRRATAISNAYNEKDDSVKKVYQEQNKLLLELQRSYRSLSKDKQRLIQIDESKLDSIEGIEKQIQKIRQLNQFYEDLNEEVNKFSSQSAKNLQQQANMASISAKNMPKGSNERREQQKKVKQYSLAANIAQSVQKNGNATAKKQFEALNQQLKVATDPKDIQRIVQSMKKLNTQIQKGQVKVSGFQNVMGGFKKEAESMAKQFNDFFGGTPIGMAAVAAGIMLIGQQIKKLSDEFANTIVSMSKMNIQMGLLKRTSETAFGSSGAIQGFRNQMVLTRQQVAKLAPQMVSFTTEGNKSLSTLTTLADNLKNSLGQLDIATFEKMMNLLKDLPQKQIQVLMGVNTDSVDTMNTYANLLKNGKISETLQIYQKGGFGEVEGMEGLSEGDKEVVKTQREIKKEIEEFKYFLFDMLPDLAKNSSLYVSMVGGLVLSIGTIVASTIKSTMALGMIAKQSVLTYKQGQVVPVIDTSKIGPSNGGKGGVKGGKFGKAAGGAMMAATTALLVGEMLNSYMTERRQKEIDSKKERRLAKEEMNKNNLQSKLKTGGALQLKDFNLDKESISDYREEQLLKRKKEYGETGGMWGAVGGAVAAGAITGAILGTVVPGIGNAVGLAIGAGVGLLAGAVGWAIGDAVGQNQAEEEEKKFQPLYDSIDSMNEALEKSFNRNKVSKEKQRQRKVNDIKHLRGIEAILKQIKNDSLTAIYTQNMQAIKGQMQVMSLLGGNKATFESLKSSMLINSSAKMGTKLFALNQKSEKVLKSDMSYEAKANAINLLQIQRAKAITEFVQTVQNSIGQYQSIPQVILNGIMEKINDLSIENLVKGFIGDEGLVGSMAQKNIETSLQSVAISFQSFQKDLQHIRNARTTLDNQKKEVVKMLDPKYVKNGQVDQEAVAVQKQKNDEEIAEIMSRFEQQKVVGDDAAKKEASKTAIDEFQKKRENYKLEDRTEGTVSQKWDEIHKVLYDTQAAISAWQSFKNTEQYKKLSAQEKREKEQLYLELKARERTLANENLTNSDTYSHASFEAMQNQNRAAMQALFTFDYATMSERDRARITQLNSENVGLIRAQGVVDTTQFQKQGELKILEEFQKQTQNYEKQLKQYINMISKNNPIVAYYEAQEKVFKTNQKYMDSAFGSAFGSVRVLDAQRKRWQQEIESIPQVKEGFEKQFREVTSEELFNETFAQSGLDENQKKYMENQRKMFILKRKAMSGDSEAQKQLEILMQETETLKGKIDLDKLNDNSFVKAYFARLSSLSQSFVELQETIARVKSQLISSIRESVKLYDTIKDSSSVYGLTKKEQSFSATVSLASYDLDVGKATDSLRKLNGIIEERYEDEKSQQQKITQMRKKDAQQRIKKLQEEYEKATDPKEKEQKRKQIQIAIAQFNNIDLQASKRLADLQLKKKQDVVKFAQQQRDLKLKILDYESQSIEIQRDLASSIGAPLQTVLSLEQQMVDNARKKLQTEQATLDYMIEKGIQGQALEDQKLRVQKQQAEVIKNSMGAQRSALQKLMGNVFGQFTKFSWMGTSNKAKIFGQGYMETSGGMTISTGGVYTGGYQSRVASANANGGIDPLTGQSYNAGGAAKRIPLGQTDSTAKNTSTKDTSAKNGSKKDEKGAKGTEIPPDDPVAKAVHQREQKKKQMAKKQELELPALQATIKTSNIVEKIYNLLVGAFGQKKDIPAKNTPTTQTTPTSGGTTPPTSAKDATPKDTSAKDTTSGNEDTPAKDTPTTQTTPTSGGTTSSTSSGTTPPTSRKKGAYSDFKIMRGHNDIVAELGFDDSDYFGYYADRMRGKVGIKKDGTPMGIDTSSYQGKKMLEYLNTNPEMIKQGDAIDSKILQKSHEIFMMEQQLPNVKKLEEFFKNNPNATTKQLYKYASEQVGLNWLPKETVRFLESFKNDDDMKLSEVNFGKNIFTHTVKLLGERRESALVAIERLKQQQAEQSQKARTYILQSAEQDGVFDSVNIQKLMNGSYGGRYDFVGKKDGKLPRIFNLGYLKSGLTFQMGKKGVDLFKGKMASQSDFFATDFLEVASAEEKEYYESLMRGNEVEKIKQFKENMYKKYQTMYGLKQKGLIKIKGKTEADQMSDEEVEKKFKLLMKTDSKFVRRVRGEQEKNKRSVTDDDVIDAIASDWQLDPSKGDINWEADWSEGEGSVMEQVRTKLKALPEDERERLMARTRSRLQKQREADIDKRKMLREHQASKKKGKPKKKGKLEIGNIHSFVYAENDEGEYVFRDQWIKSRRQEKIKQQKEEQIQKIFDELKADKSKSYGKTDEQLRLEATDIYNTRQEEEQLNGKNKWVEQKMRQLKEKDPVTYSLNMTEEQLRKKAEQMYEEEQVAKREKQEKQEKQLIALWNAKAHQFHRRTRGKSETQRQKIFDQIFSGGVDIKKVKSQTARKSSKNSRWRQKPQKEKTEGVQIADTNDKHYLVNDKMMQLLGKRDIGNISYLKEEEKELLISATMGSGALEQYKKLKTDEERAKFIADNEQAMMSKYHFLKSEQKTGAKISSMSDRTKRLREANSQYQKKGDKKIFDELSLIQMAEIFGDDQQKELAKRFMGVDTTNMSEEQKKEYYKAMSQFKGSLIGNDREENHKKIQAYLDSRQTQVDEKATGFVTSETKVAQAKEYDEKNARDERNARKDKRLFVSRNAGNLMRKLNVKNYSELMERVEGMELSELQNMDSLSRNERNAMLKEKSRSYGGGGVGTGHIQQAKSIMSMGFGGGRKETQLDRSRSGNTSEGQKQDKMKVTIQFDTQGDNIVAKVKQIAMQNAQQITNEGMRRS